MQLNRLSDSAYRLFSHPRKALAIVMGAAALFLFLRLGAHPFGEWDEARFGMSAIEMAERGDCVNIYYLGRLDTWNAKPPLATYGIVLGNALFGEGAWGLRFQAALGALMGFFFVFLLISKYKGPSFAALCCFILMGVKAIIGTHVGRTGDTDGLLFGWQMGFLYFFLSALDFNKRPHALWAGLFLGLAFLTKGVSSIFLLPGLLAYLVITRRFVSTFRNPFVWGGLLIYLLLAATWLIALKTYGAVNPNPILAEEGKTALETLLYYDVIYRYFGTPEPFGLDFIAVYWSYALNLWNALFVGAMLAVGVLFYQKRIPKATFQLRSQENRLPLLALCLWLSLGIVLTFSRNTHSWYMAPAAPFMVVTLVWLLDIFWLRWRWVSWVVGVFLVFTLARQAFYELVPPEHPQVLVENRPKIEAAHKLFLMHEIPQDMILYLKIWNPNLVPLNADSLDPQLTRPGDVLVSLPNSPQPAGPKLRPIGRDDRAALFMVMP